LGGQSFSHAANAISSPPGEYGRKAKTQRNRRGQLEEKEASLLECQEAMALKELELEEVLAKIEAILGK